MPVTTDDDECFFITPIGEDDTPERKRADGVMKAIVEPAAAANDLTVVRADEMAEPGTITAQIVEHIVGARAVVADLTGENANVYYELAVRDAAQLPAVMIAEHGTNLPFDKAQDRTIFFDSFDLASAANAKEKLEKFLKAALEGKMGNPVASAMVWKDYAGSGKPVEQAVAGLAEQVSAISVEIQGLKRALQWPVQQSAPSGSETPDPLVKATGRKGACSGGHGRESRDRQAGPSGAYCRISRERRNNTEVARSGCAVPIGGRRTQRSNESLSRTQGEWRDSLQGRSRARS